MKEEFLAVEDEGTIRLIPIKDLEELKKTSYSTREMLDQMNKSRKEELNREE